MLKYLLRLDSKNAIVVKQSHFFLNYYLDTQSFEEITFVS